MQSLSSYPERMKLLQLALGGFDGKKILELGCGKGEVVEFLKGNGADVRCLDLEHHHASKDHLTGSAVELLAKVGQKFDAAIALAFFGSPLARWCAENNQDLRKTELKIFNGVRTLLKPDGILLSYNADAWLKHMSTLTAADFEGFVLLSNYRNDTFLLQRTR